MAKKGISLNPGSDATLVAAATRAALANVPQDLSDTFEKRAESYDAMMSNIAAGYSEGIKQLVTLGKSVAKDAIASNQQIAIGKNFVIGKREIKDINDESVGVKKLVPSLVAVKETAYAPALNDIIDGKTPTTKEGIKKSGPLKKPIAKGLGIAGAGITAAAVADVATSPVEAYELEESEKNLLNKMTEAIGIDT